MKKGGALLRKELNDITYLESHPEIFQMFRDVGCYRYCEKLQGFHQGVAEAFSLTFDGAKAKVGTIELQVNEAIVAATTEIPRTGERWFKTTITKDIEFRSYLKPEHKCIIWKKDIPRSYLEEKWQHLLKEIQVYITCEGRYGRVMFYHFKLMNHFTGRCPLNLPFYLHRSLTKMTHQVQAKPSKVQGRIFHHSLIKLIVLEELQRRDKNWEYLLFWGEFEPEPQPKDKKKTSSTKSSTPQSSKRKRRAISPVIAEEPTSSSKSKRAKKMLDFSQATEGKTSASGKNVLNLPYTDSEEEVEVIEEEMPEQASPKETTPGVQSSEHEAPDFQTPEEAPFSPEAQDLEVPEASTRKHSKSASKKIKNLEEEVMELKLLEKVVKSQNETITRTSSEVRDCFQRLAKMHVKLEKKNKRLLKENKKLQKVARCLKVKLRLKDAKPIAHRAWRI
jgi:hypothetical protein